MWLKLLFILKIIKLEITFFDFLKIPDFKVFSVFCPVIIIRIPNQFVSDSSIIASASISTSMSGSTSELIPIIAEAGFILPKNSP